MKISTLFFDLGKVFVDFDFSRAFNRVAGKSPLDLTHLQDKVYADYPLIDAYESGQIGTTEFFAAMKEHFQFTGTTDELEQIWCDVFWPMEQHIFYLRSLANHYPCALISNTSEAHIRFLEPRYDFFTIFHKKIYSYEVGSMKPDAKIYLHALQEMNANKEESLFVDDREENVLAAAKLGWQTIHLRPDVDLRLALRSYELEGI